MGLVRSSFNQEISRTDDHSRKQHVRRQTPNDHDCQGLLHLRAWSKAERERKESYNILALAGLYIGVQETLEASLTAELVPLEIRDVSYGMLGSVNGIGDMVSSVVVGFLWSAVSPEVGFGFAGIVMLAGTVAMARLRSD